MSIEEPAPKRRRAGRRIAAVILLGVEALLLVAGAAYAVSALADEPEGLRTFSIALAAFLGLFAVLVGAAARSVWNFGRFGVSFGITWQLFQALVASSMLRGGFIPAGLVVLILAIALFVLLVHRDVKPDRSSLFADDA